MQRGPFVLGRYHCRERLGSSPLGSVWSARIYGPAGFEKEFAVTILDGAIVEDAELLAAGLDSRARAQALSAVPGARGGGRRTGAAVERRVLARHHPRTAGRRRCARAAARAGAPRDRERFQPAPPIDAHLSRRAGAAVQ